MNIFPAEVQQTKLAIYYGDVILVIFKTIDLIVCCFDTSLHLEGQNAPYLLVKYKDVIVKIRKHTYVLIKSVLPPELSIRS